MIGSVVHCVPSHYTGRLQKRQTLQVVGAPSSSSTTSFDPALLSSSATKADPEHVMSKERMTQLLRPFADALIPIEEASRGSIVVAVGLKHTRTGDTLLLEKGELSGSKSKGLSPSSLEGIEIPAPVFALSIAPKDSSKAKELDVALSTMTRDDPSLVIGVDPDSDQLLMEGMGELHLEVACSRLQRIQYRSCTGRVRIAYRETLAEELILVLSL